MVNYLQKFAPHLSDLTLPLWDLLNQDSEFVWEQAVHGECIKQINEVLTTAPVLRYFDPDIQTVLQCDSSDTGLGACLMQGGQPVAYASRSLTDTERNYAQCEKELLSIVFGMGKFENYVYGRKVLVESDHKPLEIICKKSLVSAPKRLQRMLLQLQKFDYHIVFKPGSQMYIADTLSRAYLPGQNQNIELNDQVLNIAYRSNTEQEIEVLSVQDYILISENTAKLIKDAGEYDSEYQQLKLLIMKGWPETREKLTEPMSTYFTFRDELSIHDGIILKGDRVVIPPGARDDIVKETHASHIGIQGCIRRAREYVYWPNMARDIEQFISKCDTCNTFGTEQQKETLISHEIPSRPWQKIGCDLFEYQGKDYMICVDYYSYYFEVDRLYKKTASKVIKTIKGHIARHGLVDELVSDNGPPFNSKEFSDFALSYEFKHTSSSPGYPQSNGKAENSVKTAKRLIKKALHAGADPYLALLDWRNTPTEGVGSSPAQRLFGRRTKTLTPATKKLLDPQSIDPVTVHGRLEQRKSIQSKYYNASAKDLHPLKTGDIVRIKPHSKKNMWKKARIEGQTDTRSYRVKTEDGGIYRRNRVHLRHTPENFDEPIHGENPDIRIEHEISDNSHKKDQEPKTVPTTLDPCLETDQSPFSGLDLGETLESEKEHVQQPEFVSSQRPSRRVGKPARYSDPDFVYS